MSDSDDTDILLLIPPNFFITETNLNESPSYVMFRSNLEPRSVKSSPGKFDKSIDGAMQFGSQVKDSVTTPPQLYYRPYNEPSPSMSALHRTTDRLTGISPSEVKSKMYGDFDRSMDRSPLDRYNKSNVASRSREFSSEKVGNLSSKKMSEWRSSIEDQQDDLVSLTNVWNHNLDFKSNHSTDLEEERLKRRHCERNIALLQTQLNQYQSKFSDALKIDQAKNDTLSKLHETNAR